MPGDLMLDSLQILRFRCFRELRIGRLARVNLIVGKNNVGKSTVLEALRLYAKPGSAFDLFQILLARDEILPADLAEWSRSYSVALPIDTLFWGRKLHSGENHEIRIGPVASPNETLAIDIEITPESPWPSIPSSAGAMAGFLSLVFRRGTSSQVLFVGSRQDVVGAVEPSRALAPIDTKPSILLFPDRPLHLIGANGLNPNDIVSLWDSVSLSAFEPHVVDALRIISPDLERIALKGPVGRSATGPPRPGADTRVPFAKVQGFDEPMPLRALGDGVNRLFGLALALVSARGGLLLVDEIENGIHYSVQADLWRLIFQTAARLNVQVFATTHSYDCIQAFETAAKESEEDGVLVRLARKGDRTLVGEFDERELEVAVEGNIEVR